MFGIASRNTREFFGFADGSRNASEFATLRNDGTVRPVRAAIRCPSSPSANSMNDQAASLFSDALVMQYASECRIPACWSTLGIGATSQSNDSIVRNTGVDRREE